MLLGPQTSIVTQEVPGSNPGGCVVVAFFMFYVLRAALGITRWNFGTKVLWNCVAVPAMWLERAESKSAMKNRNMCNMGTVV
jgi:hypothetical protein